MKTYISRLVARAQPLSAAAARTPGTPVASIEDPFTQTAPALPPPSPSVIRPAVPPAVAASRRDPSPLHTQAPAPRETAPIPPANISPAAPLVPPATLKVVPPKSTPTPPRSTTPDFPPSENPAHLTPNPATPAKAVLTPRTEKATPAASPLFHDNADPFTQSASATAPAASAEKLSPPVATTLPPATPVAGNDEARLQETADLFMARLSRRAEAILKPAPSSPLAAESTSLPAPVAAVPRLQPATPAPAAPLPPAAPSIVIGRLSVEVIPPSPAPRSSAPSPRAIRRPAARPMPAPRSSARFGLGQL